MKDYLPASSYTSQRSRAPLIAPSAGAVLVRESFEQLRANLLRELASLVREMEPGYEAFLGEAQERLTAHQNEPEFTFVVRRLWMECGGEMPLSWESRYNEFYCHFAWPRKSAGFPSDVLVKRTLSMWQRRIPHFISSDYATRMIESVGRLADAGVQP